MWLILDKKRLLWFLLNGPCNNWLCILSFINALITSPESPSGWRRGKQGLGPIDDMPDWLSTKDQNSVRTHWSPKSVLPKRVWNGGSQAFVCSRITRGYLKQISGSQWPQGSWLRTSGGGWGRVFLTSSQALLIWSGGRGGEPHLAHHVCFTHFCYSDMASGFNHFSCHFGVKRIWWHVWWCLPRNPI